MGLDKKFVKAGIVGLFVTLVLALGHLFFGIRLMNELSSDGFLVLDSYVFFLSLAFVLLIGVIYFLLIKDLSESLAVIIVGVFGLYSGLLDVLVYAFLGFPQTVYPFLIITPAGWFAKLVGLSTVPLWALISNVLILGLITFFVILGLNSFDKKFCKVKL